MDPTGTIEDEPSSDELEAAGAIMEHLESGEQPLLTIAEGPWLAPLSEEAFADSQIEPLGDTDEFALSEEAKQEWTPEEIAAAEAEPADPTTADEFNQAPSTVPEQSARTDDAMPPDLESLYEQAEQVSGYNALSLQAMALLAFEHRRNRAHMRLLSHLWERNSRPLSTSVARFPNWFMAMDGKPAIRGTTDDYLALFKISRLPLAASQEMYERWRRNGWRAYEVGENVDDWIQAQNASKGQPVRLRIKRAKIAAFSQNAEQTYTGLEISHEALDVGAPAWEGQRVEFSLKLLDPETEELPIEVEPAPDAAQEA